jgi:hypothetical protein
VKITETHDIDEDYGTGSLSVVIKTDDDWGGVEICAGEPEDNTFNRDLNDAYGIRRLLTLAYEAGKRGEPYEYEFIDENETEDDE